LNLIVLLLQGSPVPNSSVIEFSLDGVSSESVGLKRKISSLSPQSQLSPRVVPHMQMNISTYYFKHSDTEAEGSHLHDQGSHSGDSGSKHRSQRWNVTNEDRKSRTTSPPLLSREVDSGYRNWECQRSLDFSQDLNMNSSAECGPNLSSDLVFDFSQELEEMDHETTTALQDLDEIEELVQKAELLVRVGRKRQRASTGGSFRSELSAWGLSESQVGNFLPLFPESYATGCLKKYTKSISKEEALDETPTTVCPCKMNPEEVGAVGGFCLCGVETSILQGGSVVTTPKIPKKHSRVRQWVRAHNNSTILAEEKVSIINVSKV